MAKGNGNKKDTKPRNDNRPNNGKAWKKKEFDGKGRALTGRGKPSGRSRKGMRVTDVEKATFQLLR